MTCTLTGPCKAADQTAATGQVELTRRRTAEDGVLYVATKIVIPLTAGTFSKTGLQAGVYDVVERVGAGAAYTVVLPDSGTVALADLIPPVFGPSFTFSADLDGGNATSTFGSLT